jgi:prepilin-type N-terminal cleavage/methylation domain-containing protein
MSGIRARLRAIGQGEGFSLIELLVVISLLSVIGTVVLSSVIATTRIQRKNDSIVLQRDSAQTALQRLGRDLTVADPLLTADVDDVSMRVYRNGACEVHRWYVDGNGDLAVDTSTYSASTTCTNVSGTASSATTMVVAEDVATGAGALFTYSRWDSAQDQRVEIASPVGSTSIGIVDRVEISLALNTLSNQPVVEEESVDLRNVEIR